jgi:hypothetical protein
MPAETKAAAAPAAAKKPPTQPHVQVPPEGEAPARRKAAQTFSGNSKAADEPAARPVPASSGRLECPVCGGKVKPPMGAGPGKPMKCPLCMASFPIPAGYKPESVFAPGATSDNEPEPEPEPAPMSAAPMPMSSSGGVVAFTGSPADMGFSDPVLASAPAAARLDAPSSAGYKSSGEPSMLVPWIVFGVSAAIFISLLVLWRVMEH